MNQDLAHNIVVHDALAQTYERIHTEIYNDYEQARLHDALKRAQQDVSSGPSPLRVLDFGCGAGNLSQHLLALGCTVCGADVSSNFLRLVEERFTSYGDNFYTHQLNGENLQEIPDNTFDMVATYSVLHHVPDYLQAVREMVRVLKPGGVLFIDHERNEHYWNQEPVLQEYYAKNKWRVLFKKLPHLLTPYFYINRLKRMKNPRYQAEGDIHVYPDDHIEWDKIKEVLEQNSMHVVRTEDYLLYDSRYSKTLHDMYCNKTSDCKLIYAQK